MRLSTSTLRQIDPPISDVYASAEPRLGRHSLLDLAQAAPPYPPAPEVIEHVVAVAKDLHGANYVELGGLPKLREAFAAELSHDYCGEVRPEEVLVTAGCNQAFCLAASTLAEAGDEIILTLPYYFNHDMWLRLQNIHPVYLDPDPGLIPTAAAAEPLISSRTRAMVLTTPGNPSGLSLPSATIVEFAELARRAGIALILDETYRRFRGTAEPAHALFTDSGWNDTLISLHSFSKDLAIPGYRVGTIVASATLNRQIMKILDCIAICAPRIGQEAAWAGLTRAASWRTERAREIVEKRNWFTSAMADRPGGFELLSAGAFFAWMRHPFECDSTHDVVRRLARVHDVIAIPGTAFQPNDRRTIRVSYANIDREGIVDLGDRLTKFGEQTSFGAQSSTS